MEIALFLVAALCGGVAVVLAILLAGVRERAARALALQGEAEGHAQAATARLDAATEARIDAERRVAGMEAQLAAAERSLAEFEQSKQETIAQARAAALDSAHKLSSQLIEDHRRETAESRRAGEEQVRQLTEQLVRQVDDIGKAVGALHGQVQEKGRVLDTVWRSLSSPGGAGQLAEIGLANTLRGFGLEAGRDYLLQVTTADEVTGQRLRPDALVFLPGNGAIVIDCKASKYLVEIAAAETGEAEDAAYANLARTMNQHLRALADKNYRSAVQAAWRNGRSGDPVRVISLMFLPNEGAVEKLCRADPSFLEKARAAEIIPAGPAALHCALMLAASEIRTERQIENQQRIVEGTQRLIESIIDALSHANRVGVGIRTAADNFAKFSGSVNQRLLPRMRKIAALGVKPSKAVPGNLPTYAVNTIESDQLIEGEAEEVPEEPTIPRLIAE